MDKFSVVGFSTFNGKLKLRFANDMVSRIKILQRNGHQNYWLMELAQPMSKVDAAKALAERFNESAEILDAVAEFMGKRKVKDQPVEA